MNDMWEALERYQPYADKHGFGPEWRRMTTERTAKAVDVAADVAAWTAADAAWEAVKVARVAADAAARAAWAIQHINKAIALEKTL